MPASRESKPGRSRVQKEKEALEFEIGFFEGVLRQHPDYVEALQILGDDYTKMGQRENGLAVDQRLAQLCPTSPLVHYNLACSYALLNRLEEAFDALAEAVQFGYCDAAWLAKDPDLADLRRDRRFENILKDLRHRTRTGGNT